MGKAVVLAVKFDWDDVKDVKNFGDFYKKIGLMEMIEDSIVKPDEFGGEIVRDNVHATPQVMAKIATIFSHNMLEKYMDEIKDEHDEDDKISMQEVLTYVSQHEYALGYDAGMVGPEPTGFDTPTFRVMKENEAIKAGDPVIYILQSGTAEHVKPRREDAKSFLRKVKGMSNSIEKTDEMMKILKKLDEE